MGKPKRSCFNTLYKYIILLNLILLCAQATGTENKNTAKEKEENNKEKKDHENRGNSNDRKTKDCFKGEGQRKNHKSIPEAKFIRKCVHERFLLEDVDEFTSDFRRQGLRVHAFKSHVGKFKKTYLMANSINICSSDTEDMNSEITAILPQELSTKAREQQNDFSKIVFVVVDDMTLFELEDARSILNEKVVGIVVGNTSIVNMTEPVVIKMHHGTNLQNNLSHQCVVWLDVDDDSTPGHWDPTGCNTEIQDNQTICQCFHLSFFAVLLDYQSKDTALDEEVLISLTYITQIGCGISAIFSALNVILHFVYRKFQSDQAATIHINLSSALFLLNMTFLINIWVASSCSDSVCKAMAVCMHYSLLCSFTWMAIEAFQMYIMLIKVFNTYIRCYIQKLALVGWAMPAIVVILCFVTKKDNYGEYVTHTQNNSSSASICWITNKTVHYVTNGAYFALIWSCNTAVLVTVCVTLARMQKVQHNWNEKANAWKDVWTFWGLSCLLGTTWALSFLSYGPLNTSILYLFTIFNSLQGFFIFLWYCVLKRPSRQQTSSNMSTT